MSKRAVVTEAAAAVTVVVIVAGLAPFLVLCELRTKEGRLRRRGRTAKVENEIAYSPDSPVVVSPKE